jgi:ADP-ribosylglycohydrolase
MKKDNYADIVLSKINLGDASDKAEAITGGLAVLYSDVISIIPRRWLDQLAHKRISCR